MFPVILEGPYVSPPSVDVNAYSDKLAAIQASDLIAAWRMNDPSGTNIDNYEGTAARDGTIAGTYTLGETGIGDGLKSIKFEAASVDFYSANFNTAWAQAPSTVMLWAKMLNAGVWTDSAKRNLWKMLVDASNSQDVHSPTSNNQVLARVEGNGETDWLTASLSPTAWFNVILQIQEGGAGGAELFIDGTSVEVDVHTGPWAGNLDSAQTVIGAANNTHANPFSGWLAHMWIWGAILSQGEIDSIQVVP